MKGVKRKENKEMRGVGLISVMNEWANFHLVL